MAFQPVPDVALVRVEGRVDGQQTINDLYFEISGTGINATSILAITTAVAGWVVDRLIPIVCSSWTAVRATGLDLTAANSFSAEVAIGQPGDVDSEAVPNNVAACVSFRTGLAGRSFRGRNYVAAIPNSEVTLNTISPTTIVALANAYQTMVGAGLFEPGWQWGVVSRQTAGALRPTGVITPVQNAIFTTPYVRSMRSREIGHGS